MFSLSSQLQVWTQSSGGVNRIDYANSEVMSGIIAPTGALSITLQFTTFETEETYDFVLLKSCTAIDCVQSSVLGRFSGSTIPSPVTSNTGFMMIQWNSDSMVTAPGWSALWNSVISALGGTIFLISLFTSQGKPELCYLIFDSIVHV
jgi:hypothetical protein